MSEKMKTVNVTLDLERTATLAEDLTRFADVELPGLGKAIFSQCCSSHIVIELDGFQITLEMADLFCALAMVLKIEMDAEKATKRKLH